MTEGGRDVGGVAGQGLVADRDAGLMGDIGQQIDLLGVRLVVAGMPIADQLAVGVSPLEVEGRDVPVQDAQVEMPDLDRPDHEPGPEFAQMGIQGVEGAPQALVVELGSG